MWFSEITSLLNAQVTLRSPGFSPAPDGSVTSTPTTKATFWASVQPLNGDKSVIDGQPVLAATTRVICLEALDVQDGDYLVDEDGNAYDIVSARLVQSVAGDYLGMLAKGRR